MLSILIEYVLGPM